MAGKKKKPWWKLLWLNLKTHMTIVRNGYDPDFKENMKWGIKGKWRF